MATLEKIGTLIFAVAAICLAVHLRYRSLRNMEERREHKSGLQGFLKKID